MNVDPALNDWSQFEHHWLREEVERSVVLELKCVKAVPAWMIEVIRNLELRRDSISKYSLGVYLTRRLEGASRGQERARGIFR